MVGREGQCSQCERPAVLQMPGGHLLCVHCYATFMQAVVAKDDMLARLEHDTISMAEARVGMPGIFPKPTLRSAVVHSGPLTLNDIRVENSTVGSINTGTIQRLSVAVGGLGARGDAALAEAITALTEAVVSMSILSADQKNDVVEQLGLLAEEAQQPAGQRRRSVLRSSAGVAKDILTTSAAAATVWEKFGPAILAALG